MKFAVYVVMVEDTTEDDMALGADALAMERVRGDLTWVEAEDCIMKASLAAAPTPRLAPEVFPCPTCEGMTPPIRKDGEDDPSANFEGGPYVESY